MRLVAKTLYGLEEVLANELEQLGAKNVKPANRAAFFEGNKELLYKVNYCSRLALSVLKPIAEFNIDSSDSLYKECNKIDWSVFMEADSSFYVVPVVNSRIFEHTGYPALVVKDAIVDFFRKRFGHRPSVNTSDPSMVVNLHISNTRVTVSLDSTVVPLYKRGYRVEHWEASLNEVLAAGMIRLSGWDMNSPIIDPMCGSATILIEAGLMAANIPPGKFRNFFGFNNWKDYDCTLFTKVKETANALIKESKVDISGTDISQNAIEMSLRNIDNAGLKGNVNVNVGDFRDFNSPISNGLIMMNPPYGERMKVDDIMGMYNDIGSVLKHRCAGHKAWIITTNKEFLKRIGLKPFSKHVLYNGALECLFAGYEMYEGSKKHGKREIVN